MVLFETNCTVTNLGMVCSHFSLMQFWPNPPAATLKHVQSNAFMVKLKHIKSNAFHQVFPFGGCCFQ